MSLLEKCKDAIKFVDRQREYNTDTEINGWVLEYDEYKKQWRIIVNYLICYDIDIPCDESFTWFDIDKCPTATDIKELKKKGIDLYTKDYDIIDDIKIGKYSAEQIEKDVIKVIGKREWNKCSYTNKTKTNEYHETNVYMTQKGLQKVDAFIKEHPRSRLSRSLIEVNDCACIHYIVFLTA